MKGFGLILFPVILNFYSDSLSLSSSVYDECWVEFGDDTALTVTLLISSLVSVWLLVHTFRQTFSVWTVEQYFTITKEEIWAMPKQCPLHSQLGSRWLEKLINSIEHLLRWDKQLLFKTEAWIKLFMPVFVQKL